MMRLFSFVLASLSSERLTQYIETPPTIFIFILWGIEIDPYPSNREIACCCISFDQSTWRSCGKKNPNCLPLKSISPIWCLFFQLENKTGKASAASLSPADALEAPDLKAALKREREEHQHLLAESYAAVMDLTKQVPAKHRAVWSLTTTHRMRKNL